MSAPEIEHSTNAAGKVFKDMIKANLPEMKI